MQPQLISVLQQSRQAALLQHLRQLPESQQPRLLQQVQQIDWSLIAQAQAAKITATDWAALANVATPPRAFRLPPAKNPWNLKQALAAGHAALDAAQVGVLLVAGGQGTRLGFDKPKGMFPIGPVTGASLYQILCEGVASVTQRHGCEVPLYVMTSPATHDETQSFLQQHKRFGLSAAAVRLFCQGMLPALDATTGQALLSAADQLALSPDGHGGMVQALAKSGCLEDAEQRGLRYLFYLQVDNPLVKIADPEFLGYHILSGSEMSTQVIAKRAPTEKVGNVVTINGQTQIIEYSDLPASAAERTSESGEPIFWAGSIAVHVIDVAFLRRIADSTNGLPLHIARKKVSYWNGEQTISPNDVNAIKLERFIFDLLPLARESIVMEVDRATNFAPVKNSNAEPLDNPRTVQAQMSALYASWLQSLGVQVAAEVPLEISPLIARSADELRAAVDKLEITLPEQIQQAWSLR
jgi:UDP-N-acetylglucosamine/UDP-N-acetylgalactosamine diphosphorylase